MFDSLFPTLSKKIIGFKEMIKICIAGKELIASATCDTGNGGVSPTLSVEEVVYNPDTNKVSFKFDGHSFCERVVGKATPSVGTETPERYTVLCDYIEVDGRKVNDTFIAVSDKRKKSTQALLNRTVMRELNLLVDPGKSFTYKVKE